MTEKVEMQLIPIPNWTRKPEIKIEENAQSAFEIFESKMTEVRKLLQIKIENFVNNSDQCFLNEDEGFPLKESISGEYYFSDILYRQEFRNNQNAYEMWIMIHCLEKQWFAKQTNFDYLGLEAILILSDNSEEIEFDGFNTSSI